MAANTIDAQAVLAQMRALTAQSRGVELQRPPAVAGADFGSALKHAIDAVNNQQQQAGTLSDKFERGVPGIDVGQVMIAIQKANVSFQAVTQVRNKLVTAYQDIMNMPL